MCTHVAMDPNADSIKQLISSSEKLANLVQKLGENQTWEQKYIRVLEEKLDVASENKALLRKLSIKDKEIECLKSEIAKRTKEREVQDFISFDEESQPQQLSLASNAKQQAVPNQPNQRTALVRQNQSLSEKTSKSKDTEEKSIFAKQAEQNAGRDKENQAENRKFLSPLPSTSRGTRTVFERTNNENISFGRNDVLLSKRASKENELNWQAGILTEQNGKIVGPFQDSRSSTPKNDRQDASSLSLMSSITSEQEEFLLASSVNPDVSSNFDSFSGKMQFRQKV